MIVDEMEMVGRLRDVDPLPAEVSERAKLVLQAAMAADADTQVIEFSRQPKRRRRTMVVRGGVAVGVAAAAAVAVLVAGSAVEAPKLPGAASHHIASPLVRLADYVSASATPSGNATLVARTTAGVTVYDLYTDSGQYFFSPTESGLPGQISSDNDQADGLFAREIAAAKLGATGNVQAAAHALADAPDPSHVISPSPANSAAIAAKKAAVGGQQAGNLFDSWVWEDSLDAIIAGSGDPQVRAGVLRILATLPDVSVTSSTSAGQPTDVLTSGTAEEGPGYSEQLTINATTGIPVSFVGGVPGQAPLATVSYQVSRVTLSDIVAGKF
jgi:hypothetical protein